MVPTDFFAPAGTLSPRLALDLPDAGFLIAGQDMPDNDTRQRQRREAVRARFEQEIERLLDRLYGTALRLTRNPDDAEDVVAEAVEKAWEQVPKLRDWARFEGWMFRILNNTFVTLWRRRRSRQDRETAVDELSRDSVDAASFSLFQKLHQPFLLWWGTPEEQFVDGLVQEDLAKAVDALPDAYRLVVVLVELQGYTYEEAAALLALPVGTVRSRLNRGRGLLQKALWEYGRHADEGQPPGPKHTQSGGE